MRDFWKTLTSIKLAITLIAVIGVGSLISTVVPQGESSGTYFGSALFLVPLVLFFLNLGACTVARLRRELGKKTKRRHGPDILHIGLLILILGGFLTAAARKEGMVMLAPGESADLPGGEILRLVRFEEELYPDGRPKGWTSIVDVEKNGTSIHAGQSIKVNKPLRVGRVKLYQASYSNDPIVIVKNVEGRTFELSRGQTFNGRNVKFFFMTIAHGQGGGTELEAVLRIEDKGVDSTLQLGRQGRNVGGYDLVVSERLSTGIQAVSDPGYPLVLAALLLVGFGTALTFLQKLRDVDKA